MDFKTETTEKLEHYLFTPDGIGKKAKKLVFEELVERANAIAVHNEQKYYKEDKEE